ncbi:hypothetical protein SAMN05421756_110136 [Microlunatus flavus]|uniref:Uncharacterized protein n=1 Tax=Microlunatus flavus TaxID=1036181 RepID=A0A1H9MHP5_9ACTN|nr:hypothetical protein SAMN05421756_110136 [Microlunatus flavus]
MLVLVLLAGCSWGGQEPGLFTTPAPSVAPVPEPAPSATEPSSSVPAARPRLPVLAEALWTTADGNGVTVRFAVHAIRRSTGVTVLDWSVTPLAGPGRRAGDLVPSGTDLGLTRTLAAEQAVALLDVEGGRVYRPLADVVRQRFRRCLCTPLFVVAPQLRFGETTLLQLAFPPLAEGTSRLDVVLPNVAVVPGVPVSPLGITPVAEQTPDLTRPPVAGNPETGAKTWTARDAGGRQQTVVVNAVVAGRGLTSVVWTLHSVDDQPGLGSQPGPPLSTPPPAGVRVLTDNPASGPQLRVQGRKDPVRVRWTTATFADRPAYECLCSGLGLWSRGLRYGGGSAHLATHVGPLPPGTRRVDVRFPGLPAFTDVPVTWRTDVTGRVQTVEPSPDATWTYDEADPPSGWSADRWPTPLPDERQLGDYASRPERLLAALPGA